MLEKIREGSQGPWAMAIIALIVLSFVFAGVGSYLNSSGNPAAAVVNGEEISTQALERAYQNQRGRMEAQYGESIASLFSSEEYMKEFRRNVLEGLISEKLIQQQAAALGLRVSDQQIKEAIWDMEQFQYNGQFDPERFQMILRQNGYQAKDFRNIMRGQMTQAQLATAISSSQFALPSEVERVHKLQSQTRDVQYVSVDTATFADSVDVSEDEIQSYYDANLAMFDTQEKVSLSYVLLEADSLTDSVSVTPEEVKAYYDTNLNAYRSEEERRVSHILIDSSADEVAAKEKAQALLSRINGGEDFAQVAKAESDDAFSAENGGDLDYITKDMMEPEFEAAAFALTSVGDVSDLVKTEFGFHIIKLTDIKAEQTTPFEEVKNDIQATLLKEKALDKFYTLQNTMAELAFEVPDTLEDVASALGLKIATTDLFDRDSVPAELDTPALIDVAFSQQLVREGLNSDVIDLGDDRVAVVRVADYAPQRTKTLDEVVTTVTDILKAEKAQDAAIAWTKELAAAIESEQADRVTDMLASKTLTWQNQSNVRRQGNELAPNVVDALFGLATEKGKNIDIVQAGNEIVLLELLAVNDAPELDKVSGEQLSAQLKQFFGQRGYQQYVDALRENAEVTINTI